MKEYVVVTFGRRVEDRIPTHAYGPYTRNKAIAVARKTMQDEQKIYARAVKLINLEEMNNAQ